MQTEKKRIGKAGKKGDETEIGQYHRTQLLKQNCLWCVPTHLHSGGRP